MSRQSEILDGLVDGSVTLAPMEELRLPRPASWSPGRVQGLWTVDLRMLHAGGAVFGGYLAAMCDNACAMAVRSTLDDTESFSTADLDVSFLRPVRGGVLRWEARVIHRGRRVAHVEVSYADSEGVPLVTARAVQVIIAAAE